MNGFTLLEYQRRIKSITEYLNSEDVDGMLIFNPYNAFYLGHYYYPGKRPVVFFVHRSGEVIIICPKMELHEANKLIHVNKVYAYDDNLSSKADLFSFLDKNLRSNYSTLNKIIVDEIGLMGYQRLTEIFKDIIIDNIVMKIRTIKSIEEIETLKVAAYYSDFIVHTGKNIVKPGMTELGLLNRMVTKTVDKMIEDMGEIIYVPGGPAGALVPSGTRTALPHALPSAKEIQMGDTLILSCGANVWGYRIECERTFFIGEPSKEKIEAFNVMKEAQELGISLMKPGAICEDVEKKVIEYITKNGYGQFLRHRTGHGKGLEEHETPYIAAGDETVIKEGMVFSSEPGIYIEELSGFRHSDIVLVTKDGPKVLTKYSKQLKDLVIEL